MSELPAGRELDAEVAYRVMGWKWVRRVRPFHDKFLVPPDFPVGVEHDLLPAGVMELSDPPNEPLSIFYFVRLVEYSTDISAAFQVLNHFPGPRLIRFDGTKWWAEITVGDTRYVAPAETAELAICRAALKARD